MARIATSTINQRGVDGILNNQVELSKIQKQMATGKRVVTPADDPVAATQMLNLDKNVRVTEQYQSNIDYARNHLSQTDETLGSVGNLLQRVRELAVRANTDSLSDANRESIAAEVESRLDELMGLANTKDGSGEYLFAGSKGSTKPFSYSAANGYEYHGDQRERNLKIGPEFDVQQTDAGDEVFMGVERGNGRFVADYDDGNTGSGRITATGIADAGALLDHEYTLTVQPDGAGGQEIQVTDDDEGTAVTTVPYQPGEAFEFEGVTMTIDGSPDNTDQFRVSSSRSQSVFQTVRDMLETLRSDWSGGEARAKAAMDMDTAIRELDNAQNNILNVRSSIGARLNSVESQETVNEAYTVQMKETLSQVQDLDYAKASSDLNLRMVGLQAAQQVYTRVQGLSLFNQIG
ncbi:flagellar hook-associated protein 3 FlgL [Thiohalospira halophila DSM 15071]|uniref:Flagellar hook-associated protein 3 FlgL n=1 Tax=Thiohalospira halophila DSM 15071 TaxID=1123397 RepID=A0A1I1WC70_9GAMM|nr:flagellar hook-associated protein FlgL [Thiohalospira halophila]SFD92744.1 flagellar hook-associated protein 3 FlgL [Thiohalospira halophila DSM 15071]